MKWLLLIIVPAWAGYYDIPLFYVIYPCFLLASVSFCISLSEKSPMEALRAIGGYACLFALFKFIYKIVRG